MSGPAAGPKRTQGRRLSKEEVLAGLDIAAEYRAMGAEFTASRPGDNGWLACRAVGREDRRPSASVNLNTGAYKDHGSGGESLSFWDFAVKYGGHPNFREALSHYAAKVGHTPATNGVNKRRALARSRPKQTFATLEAAANWAARLDSVKGKGEPAAQVVGQWCYSDGFAVVRFLRSDGNKEYRPFHRYSESGQWVLGDPPGPLPLYNLAAIEAQRSEEIFVFEGEKCCEIGKSLRLVSTTSAHGARSADKTDWTPLAGLVVTIVPDSGEAGLAYRDEVLGQLSALDPRPQVRVIELPGLSAAGDDIEQWKDLRPGASHEAMRAELLQLAESRLFEDLSQIVKVGRNGHRVANGRHPPPPSSLRVAADGPIQPNEAPDDPHRLARIVLDNHNRHPDGLTLRYWQGEWMEWKGAYRPVLSEDIRARLNAAVKDEFDRLNVEQISRWRPEPDGESEGPPTVRKVTSKLVSDILGAVSGYARLEPRTPFPSWLAEPAPFPPQDVLPTRNALVYLPGLVEGRPDAIRSPTPLFFCPYTLDYDFDPKAPEPVEWLTFLGTLPVSAASRVKLQLWPDDPESIAALQEWFGLLLTPDTSYEKILMLLGPKRSGKGTIARVIKAMIGSENVTNPTLSSLTTNFGLAPLIGKPAAIITDARLSGRTDIAQVVEQLLAISGEDARTIDRKHLPPVTVDLPTRFTLISNELPRLPDASGSLPSRMILLRLTESFYGNEDRELAATLKKELPGILLWAIEGWRRLRERGRFVQPEAGKGMVEELEDQSSPIGAFLKERCRIDPKAEVRRDELFKEWRAFCEQRNRNPGEESTFGRHLHAAIPTLDSGQKRVPGDGVKRVYRGVELDLSLSPF